MKSVMRQRRVWWLGLMLALSGALLAACTPSATPAPTPGSSETATQSALRGEVVVFAASSLTEAFREMGELFQREHPESKVTFNFGGSSQLRTQLEQGAAAEVFASADEVQMREVEQAGLTASDPRIFARNRLAIIVPVDNPGGVESLADLARPGLKLVTTQAAVPVGRYTMQMLDQAAADPAQGAEFKAQAEANIVSREDNVRQVVAKVQLGVADAGVVYTSDVTPSVADKLRVIPIPDRHNVVASYPIAPIESGANPGAGEAFIALVLSDEGQEILERWGFQPAEP